MARGAPFLVLMLRCMLGVHVLRMLCSPNRPMVWLPLQTVSAIAHLTSCLVSMSAFVTLGAAIADLPWAGVRANEPAAALLDRGGASSGLAVMVQARVGDVAVLARLLDQCAAGRVRKHPCPCMLSSLCAVHPQICA